MRWRWTALLAACLLGLLLAPVAEAEKELAPGGMALEILDAAGNPVTQAGSHPDRMLTRILPTSGSEKVKDIEIAFPNGMGGSLSGIPACPRAEFDAPANTETFEEPNCPSATRVGTMRNVIPGGEETFPIFNLVPGPEEVAAFGIRVNFINYKLSSRLRGSELGFSTTMQSISSQRFFGEAGEEGKERIFEFWGVPADHQEGPEKAPRRAFLTLPTRCDKGPLTETVRQNTWQHPDEYSRGSASTGRSVSGCAGLPFAPKIQVAMEHPVAGAATGMTLNMEFPQTEGPDERASAQASSMRFEFPAGTGLSLGAAAHLGACSEAELAKGTETPAACPPSSKVGTVQIGVPDLSAPLAGNVYMGQQLPDESFPLFVVARGDGVEQKFVSTMKADPVTGRLTTVLDGLPDAVIDHMQMNFDGGPRALFVAPDRCGPVTVNAAIAPNDGDPPVQASDSVTLGPAPGTGCGDRPPFAPALTTAISNPRAGAPTDFSTLIERREGEQSIDRFSFAFPPGLNARLGATEACSDAAAAAANCPPGSKVGTSYVAIGTGSEVAELSGDAFLTGPQGKEPFGVAMALKAKIGPFDLGTFNVRAGMKMDPLTGQVSVQTDSLPQTVQGIPLNFRSIGLQIDRPGFMTAPTSCEPHPVKATITSTQGATASPSSSFELAGCAGLPFKPAFSLALTDRAEMHRHGRPGMRMTIASKPGEANLRDMAMLLPGALSFNVGSLKEICSRRQAASGKCPKASQVGTGLGRTPLIKKPMKGAIYVVQPQGGGEPDLWVALHGEGLELNMRSTSRKHHGKVENVFEELPDVPMSEFTTEFAAGGVLSLRRGLCAGGHRARLRAATRLGGQNGASSQRQTPVQVPKACGAR